MWLRTIKTSGLSFHHWACKLLLRRTAVDYCNFINLRLFGNEVHQPALTEVNLFVANKWKEWRGQKQIEIHSASSQKTQTKVLNYLNILKLIRSAILSIFDHGCIPSYCHTNELQNTEGIKETMNSLRSNCIMIKSNLLFLQPMVRLFFLGLVPCQPPLFLSEGLLIRKNLFDKGTWLV